MKKALFEIEIKRMQVLAGVIKENQEFDSLKEEELKEIMNGYLSTALWTEEEILKDQIQNGNDHDDDDEDDDDESEIDRIIRMQSSLNSKGVDSFTKEHIEPNSLIQAYLDIKKFIQLAGINAVQEAVDDDGLEHLGHNIWLSRNRHGAGFFDHPYEHEEQLTKAAHDLGEVYMYIDDNGTIRFSNES